MRSFVPPPLRQQPSNHSCNSGSFQISVSSLKSIELFCFLLQLLISGVDGVRGNVSNCLPATFQ